MLPASDLAEIISNLAGLNLQPNTTAQILAAVLAPLLRSAEPQRPVLPRQRAERPRVRPRRAARQKKPKHRAGDQNEHSDRDAPRQRAIAALKANPGASLTAVAKTAGVSRSTVVNASADLAAAARKQARREARQQVRSQTKPVPTDRRERARGFLRDELADGPKPVTTVEAAASKAHVDPTASARRPRHRRQPQQRRRRPGGAVELARVSERRSHDQQATLLPRVGGEHQGRRRVFVLINEFVELSSHAIK